MAAGAAYTGRNMFMGVAIQSDVSTAGTVFEYFQPTDISGIIEEYDFKTSDKRVGTRFKAPGRKSAKKVPFSFTVELTPDCGRLLFLMTGADDLTVVVAGEVGSHEFTFEEVLPYFTLVVDSAGVADVTGPGKSHRVTGCKVGSWSIKGSVDGATLLLTITGEGMARDEITTPTPSYGTALPFILHADEAYGTISLGASIGAVAQFDECIELSLEGDNGISADRRINGSGTPVGMREGDSSMKGSFKAIYNEETWAEIDIFQAGTDRSMVVEVKHDASFHLTNEKTLTLSADKTRYSGTPTAFDPDVISTSLSFDIENTASLTLTLINEKVVAYSASA